MGDNLLKRQLRNFRRRMDKAKEDLLLPRLFSRPELVDTDYYALPVDQKTIVVDEKLLAFGQKDGTVLLLQGHESIAVLNGESGLALHAALTEPDTGGVVLVRVVDIEPLSGGFKVRIVRD